MSAPSPRRFTRAELTSTISTGAYNAMFPADREAFDQQLVDLWVANASAQSLADFNRDFDLVASNRRYEIGE